MTEIRQISNCLPAEMADTVATFIKGGSWRHGWPSNKSMGYTHWNQDYGRGSAENSLDISHNLRDPLATVWTYLQTQHFPNTHLLRCYANGHTYGIEGYPHTDSSREYDRTIVIYLNEGWRREWGGETLIYDQDQIIHAELPKYNTGLVFPGNKWHVARGVTRICPHLRMTLMFKFCPDNVDNKRDEIQKFLQDVGANKTPHSDGNLMGHLLRTYDILKIQGYSDAICNAGALHSIFGTNIFQHKTLNPADRPHIEALIGAEATVLVELFCKINRPATLENALENGNCVVHCNNGADMTITQEQLNSLCAIEAANLHDQAGLDYYPRIKTFLKI